MGPEDTTHRVASLSLYLLDTTALVAQLRGGEAMTSFLLAPLGRSSRAGDELRKRRRGGAWDPAARAQSSRSLLTRLRFLETTREAATRAGRYQLEFERRGVTITDALVAGTARVHGTILLTDNLQDFPMRDLKVEAQPIN